MDHEIFIRPVATDHVVHGHGVNLHYIKYENPDKPVLLLLHGLTANCRAFEGLISNGLHKHFSIVSVDLRGRGLSDKPLFGYSLKMHALDIIELIRRLNLKKVNVVGHSYGGLLASFLCNFYPRTFSKLVLLDSAPEMNKKTPEMLQTALSRLDKVYTNKQEYLDSIKKAPYITFWDDDMLTYFDADIEVLENGTASPRPNLAQIMQVAFDVGISPLPKYFKALRQHAMLICATENYNLGEPILPGYLAEKAAANMKNCKLEYVEANHHTMVYGKYAKQIVGYIEEFMAV
jgi:pimeloyl-ACP methyl ester carboxylesterase